jgi:hypothetical protein
MVVNLLIIIALLYSAVLFIRNIPVKTAILYFLDILAAVLLYLNGTAAGQIIVFISIAFTSNIFVIVASTGTDVPVKKSRTAFIYALVPALAVIICAFFLRHAGVPAVVTAAENFSVPAVFFVFCTVFTALYFIMKEEIVEGGNE